VTDSPDAFDLVGVGIGPANLSLAALVSGIPQLSAIFLDRKPSFSWHDGIMLPGAQMQVHFLKDLVTAVDPTNRFSFPTFLVATRRLYRLLVTGRSHIPRKEFEQYCRWVAEQLDDLRWGVTVENLEWDGTSFVAYTSEGLIRARNVVSGTGLEPLLPPCAAGHDPARVFHASRYLNRRPDVAGQRVAVVGGGQSGAEVVHHLLTSETGRPARVVWGTQRSNLLPLDESPFVEELFLPNYSRHFHRLPAHERESLIEQQRMASDGVSIGLLEAIYQRLYDLELLEGVERPCRIMTAHRLAGLDREAGGLVTTWRSTRSGAVVREPVDAVVCATGYRHALPELLDGLRDRLPLRAGRPVVRADFSLEWDGPAGNRIFVQNAARPEFGVADPNLSLLAWRSGTIVNSLLGYERYDADAVSGALDWETDWDGDCGTDVDPVTDVVEPPFDERSAGQRAGAAAATTPRTNP
jgi:lysine N6-hydroxylase